MEAARAWWEFALRLDPHNPRVHEQLSILKRVSARPPAPPPGHGPPEPAPLSPPSAWGDDDDEDDDTPVSQPMPTGRRAEPWNWSPDAGGSNGPVPAIAPPNPAPRPQPPQAAQPAQIAHQGYGPSGLAAPGQPASYDQTAARDPYGRPIPAAPPPGYPAGYGAPPSYGRPASADSSHAQMPIAGYALPAQGPGYAPTAPGYPRASPYAATQAPPHPGYGVDAYGQPAYPAGPSPQMQPPGYLGGYQGQGSTPGVLIPAGGYGEPPTPIGYPSPPPPYGYAGGYAPGREHPSPQMAAPPYGYPHSANGSSPQMAPPYGYPQNAGGSSPQMAPPYGYPHSAEASSPQMAPPYGYPQSADGSSPQMAPPPYGYPQSAEASSPQMAPPPYGYPHSADGSSPQMAPPPYGYPQSAEASSPQMPPPPLGYPQSAESSSPQMSPPPLGYPSSAESSSPQMSPRPSGYRRAAPMPPPPVDERAPPKFALDRRSSEPIPLGEPIEEGPPGFVGADGWAPPPPPVGFTPGAGAPPAHMQWESSDPVLPAVPTIAPPIIAGIPEAPPRSSDAPLPGFVGVVDRIEFDRVCRGWAGIPRRLTGGRLAVRRRRVVSRLGREIEWIVGGRARHSPAHRLAGCPRWRVGGERRQTRQHGRIRWRIDERRGRQGVVRNRVAHALAGTAPPPPPPPIVMGEAVASGGSILKSAKDRVDLDDLDGAVEVLGSMPNGAPEMAEARSLMGSIQSRLQQQYEAKVGSLDAVPRVLVTDEQLIWMNMNHRVGYVLSQVDGHSAYDDIVALSGMPRVDTLKILSDLIADGVIGS